jgi:hypothetical protein
VLQLCTNHFVWVVCRPVWVTKACQLFLVPSRSSNPPLYPSKGGELGSVLQLLLFRCFLLGLTFEPFKELRVRHARPTSWSSSDVCSMGGWINMPRDIALICELLSSSLWSRFWFKAESLYSACRTLKWPWSLSLRSNVVVQPSTGQGYLPSIDQLTVIRPVVVQILQVDWCTNRRCPSRWWEATKQMLHSGHQKSAMNIGW